MRGKNAQGNKKLIIAELETQNRAQQTRGKIRRKNYPNVPSRREQAPDVSEYRTYLYQKSQIFRSF